MSDRANVIVFELRFDRDKSREHVERIAHRLRRDWQEQVNARWPVQLPVVHLAEIAYVDDDGDDDV